MIHHLIIGTAGHVDHGKTALIKALTDFDCDTHKQEKERGITINLGFSHLTLPSGESVGIVDMPGHKDFIKTMVAGAYGIDLVLLVIAADSGVMPQTIEHLNIIRMLGIRNSVVVLNKIDLVDEEMVELAKLEIMELLEDTGISDAPVVGVSSITGQGLDELITALDQQVKEIPEREGSGVFRMFIDRIFNVKGIGTVVTGSVLNGKIKAGDDLYLLPGFGKKIKIKSIERHGSKVETVTAGDRAAINLGGLKLQDFSRGMILSGELIDEVSIVDATLTLFDMDVRLGIWSTVLFLTGTFECLAKIHLIDKEELHKGDTAIVQIHLEKPHILVNKDKYIIRNSSSDLTLGGGTIFDTTPQHHRKRTPKLVEQLKVVVDATLSDGSVMDLIRMDLMKATKPMDIAIFEERYQTGAEEILMGCSDRKDQISVYKSSGYTFLMDVAADNSNFKKIIEEISEWHQKNPLSELGIEEKAFAGKLGLPGDEMSKAYINELIRKANQNNLIKRVANTWALIDHAVKIDQKTQDQLQWIEDYIKGCGMNKPLFEELQEAALDQRIPKDKIRKMISWLAGKQKIVVHEADFLHKDNLDKCRTIILNDLVHRERGINEKDFREMLGCSKKMTQLLLGIFLEEGIISKRSFFIDITEKGRALVIPNSKLQYPNSK
jgi:selenocysteine-specific elongation factor